MNARLLCRLVVVALGTMTLAGHAVAGCKPDRIAEIPVTMEGRSPVITAKINGLDARMIFDIGSVDSMLFAGNATKFRLDPDPNPPHVHFTSNGKPLDVSFGIAKEFSFTGLTFRNVEFSLLEGGGDVDGLVGQNHIGDADVEYDLANGVIRLYAPNECTDAKAVDWGAQRAVSVIDIEDSSRSTRIFGIVTINGVFIRALFDTGTPNSAVESRAAARAGVTPDIEGAIAVEASRGLNPHYELRTWMGNFASFKIGNEEIRDAKLRFVEKPNASADMIIGADFFLAHHVYISKRQRKLYFSYNGGPLFESSSVAPAAGK